MKTKKLKEKITSSNKFYFNYHLIINANKIKKFTLKK